MTEQTSKRPTRRQVMISASLFGAAVVAGTAYDLAPGRGLKTAERKGTAFGTIVSLKAAHSNANVLERALDAAWAEMVRVEMAASLFRPQSAICALNNAGVLEKPPAVLVQSLRQALEISRLTEGAFDPTVQPLWQLYDRAYKAGRQAGAQEIAQASALIDWRGVDVADDRIRFSRPGMALTLNGIAQGFAAERSLAVLVEHGIEHAFLDTGELAASGRRDGETDWTAAIAHPRRHGSYAGIARPLHGVLATSGDYATVWSDDYSHHHILDPKTRRSPPVIASVSVIAPSGGLADGLSTAMMVLGPERSLALAASLPGVEALIIAKSGERRATAAFPLA